VQFNMNENVGYRNLFAHEQSSKPERVYNVSNYAQVSIGFHSIENTHIYNARKEVKN